MERANAESGRRKRIRDQGDVEKGARRKANKPQICINESSHDEKKSQNDQFYEGFGVFDFPWLKEGVVFRADEYFDQESTFAASFEQSCEQDNAEVVVGGTSYREKKLEDDGFWSFADEHEVDGFESIDRILSLVIDQPVIDVECNKA